MNVLITVVLIFLSSIVSQKLEESGCGEKMDLSVAETEPACSKPPAGVDMRIGGERRDFGALAPSLTRALPILFSGASEGSAELSKLV